MRISIPAGEPGTCTRVDANGETFVVYHAARRPPEYGQRVHNGLVNCSDLRRQVPAAAELKADLLVLYPAGTGWLVAFRQWSILGAISAQTIRSFGEGEGRLTRVPASGGLAPSDSLCGGPEWDLEFAAGGQGKLDDMLRSRKAPAGGDGFFFREARRELARAEKSDAAWRKAERAHGIPNAR